EQSGGKQHEQRQHPFQAKARGKPAEQGGTLLSIGGIFGAALLGGLAARFRLERVLALFMLLTAALLALFSL
ncbi:hypothetical protein ACV34T_31545, partial [Pseudomonas aeruginosa]